MHVNPLRKVSVSKSSRKPLGSKTLKQKQEANGRTLALDGAAWRKLRALVLSSEPLCRHCTARGLTVIATELDHRNGPNDNRLESLQPLCKSCHSRQTARDMGHNVSMGCDVHGMPLDPSSPWSNAAQARLTRPEISLQTEGPQTDRSLSFHPNCKSQP